MERKINLISDKIANPYGYGIAISVSLITFITFIIAMFTPPVSGPFCQENCIGYPYLEIVSRFPRDYYWMFPAMLMCLGFVAVLAVIHQAAPAEKKALSLLGFSCGLLAAGVLIIDYFVQLAVIQPSLLMGETEGIALLTQNNPHGIFIALEDVGYLLMSISLGCMAFVFSTATKKETTVRWIFLLDFLLTVISLIVISLIYGIMRGYRFEVYSIGLNWLTLIVMGIPLAGIFRSQTKLGRGG